VLYVHFQTNATTSSPRHQWSLSRSSSTRHSTVTYQT